MAPLIELEHIIDALQGFKRPLREGREALVNLIVCGITSKTPKEVKVEALCVRTTKISEPPVKINVSIDPSSKVKIEEKIIAISCTCPSGASKEHSCKHAMACLLYLERNDESTLEKLTCTDIEQRWGGMQQQTMAQFDPIPISDFCHVSQPQSPYRRPILAELPNDMILEFRNLFLEAQPNSEAAVFLSGVRHNNNISLDEGSNDFNANLASSQIQEIVDNALNNSSFIVKVAQELGDSLYKNCTAEEREYFDKYIKIEDSESLQIFNRTIDQDGDEWLEMKYGRLTGSISYSYHTYYQNRRKHTDVDWCNKIKSTFSPSGFSTKNMEDGKFYEGHAVVCYEAKYPGRSIKKAGILINPLVPWLGYSADGVIYEDGHIKRLFEVKTPAKGATHGADTICNVLSYMKNEKLKEKHDYYGQVQLGMLLLSLPICDFSLYCHKPNQIFVDSIVFNEKFCLDFVKNLTNAFFSKILPWLVSQVET